MKYCTHCGQQLDDSAAFCSKCGKPIGTVDNTERHTDDNRARTETTVPKGKIDIIRKPMNRSIIMVKTLTTLSSILGVALLTIGLFQRLAVKSGYGIPNGSLLSKLSEFGQYSDYLVMGGVLLGIGLLCGVSLAISKAMIDK